MTKLKKPLATLAVIGAVGVTAGLTTIASAAVGNANGANAPVTGTMGMSGMMGRRAPGIRGTVSSISGTTIMVAGKDGTTYTVDASNAKFFKAGGAGTVPGAATIADIKVGDTVGIRGTVSGTSVAATDVMDGVAPMGMHGRGGMMGHGVRGTVSAINGTTITVTNANGTTYSVDASKATVSKIVTEAVADIKVGDTLGIEGTISGTSVTANHIMNGSFPKGSNSQ